MDKKEKVKKCMAELRRIDRVVLETVAEFVRPGSTYKGPKTRHRGVSYTDMANRQAAQTSNSRPQSR